MAEVGRSNIVCFSVAKENDLRYPVVRMLVAKMCKKYQRFKIVPKGCSPLSTQETGA